MIPFGKPAGPNSPYQVFNSNPGIVSEILGTDARMGVLFRVVVPSGVSFPAWTCGRTVEVLVI